MENKMPFDYKKFIKTVNKSCDDTSIFDEIQTSISSDEENKKDFKSLLYLGVKTFSDAERQLKELGQTPNLNVAESLCAFFIEMGIRYERENPTLP
jgi:cytochrome b involved in lipid metabolism